MRGVVPGQATYVYAVLSIIVRTQWFLDVPRMCRRQQQFLPRGREGLSDGGGARPVGSSPLLPSFLLFFVGKLPYVGVC